MRTRVVAALTEGCSIRTTARMTGASRPTILKLIANLGSACQHYHDQHVINLTTRRIECRRQWSFVAKKDKTVPAEWRGEYGIGDVWVWVCTDSDSKLVIAWLVGLQTFEHASVVLNDVASRLANRVQLTTDGPNVYLEAREESPGGCDLGTLHKIYSTLPVLQTLYISTSSVERLNLTTRTGLRRFTRLTNGRFKKIELHEDAIPMHYFHYNYCRLQPTLRSTPAIAAGITDHLWSLEDMVGLLETDPCQVLA